MADYWFTSEDINSEEWKSKPVRITSLDVKLVYVSQYAMYANDAAKFGLLL